MNFKNILPESSDWISIEDTNLLKLILESYLDEEKKKIISSVISKAKISSEILKECNLPRSSGYRKIKSLINDGLLYPKDKIKFANEAVAIKYISIISGLKIDFNEGKVFVKVRRNQNSF